MASTEGKTMESRSGYNEDEIRQFFRGVHNDIDLANISNHVWELFRETEDNPQTLMRRMSRQLYLHCSKEQIDEFHRLLAVAFRGADEARRLSIEEHINRFIANPNNDTKGQQLVDDIRQFIAELHIDDQELAARTTLLTNLRTQWFEPIQKLKDAETKIFHPVSRLYVKTMTEIFRSLSFPATTVQEFNEQMVYMRETLVPKVNELLEKLKRLGNKIELTNDFLPAEVMRGIEITENSATKQLKMDATLLLKKFETLLEQIETLKFSIGSRSKKEVLRSDVNKLIDEINNMVINFNAAINKTLQHTTQQTFVDSTRKMSDKLSEPKRPRLTTQQSRKDVTNPDSSPPLSQTRKKPPKTTDQQITGNPKSQPSPTRERSLAVADEGEAKFTLDSHQLFGNTKEKKRKPARAPEKIHESSKEEEPQRPSRRSGRKSSTSE